LDRFRISGINGVVNARQSDAFGHQRLKPVAERLHQPPAVAAEHNGVRGVQHGKIGVVLDDHRGDSGRVLVEDARKHAKGGAVGVAAVAMARGSVHEDDLLLRCCGGGVGGNGHRAERDQRQRQGEEERETVVSHKEWIGFGGPQETARTVG
jgi:hypothetical protein